MAERQYEQLRQPFTESEIAVMHDELVIEVGNVKELRGQKAAATNNLNAAIKNAEKSVWDLQGKLALGYQLVDVEVIAAMDDPEPGMKTIIRADTSERLRSEPMTLKERQSSFGFDDRVGGP
jgi:hypothetical protein